MNCRLAKSERTGTDGRLGKTERMTCGIVSPARKSAWERVLIRDILTNDDPEGAHSCHR